MHNEEALLAEIQHQLTALYAPSGGSGKGGLALSSFGIRVVGSSAPVGDATLAPLMAPSMLLGELFLLKGVRLYFLFFLCFSSKK